MQSWLRIRKEPFKKNRAELQAFSEKYSIFGFFRKLQSYLYVVNHELMRLNMTLCQNICNRIKHFQLYLIHFWAKALNKQNFFYFENNNNYYHFVFSIFRSTCVWICTRFKFKHIVNFYIR